MNKSVDFYYDYGSLNSYLAWTQLPTLCANAQATLNYKPMLLGGVFKSTGNTSPMLVAAKAVYLKEDVARYAQHYRVPFIMNPYFPLNTVGIMRGAMWALSAGCLEEYNRAMFEAVWVNQKNMADPEVITDVLENAGFDAGTVIEATGQQQIKDELIKATNEAVERGVFGAPTMFVGGQMFFGQDRLDWVKRALSAASTE